MYLVQFAVYWKILKPTYKTILREFSEVIHTLQENYNLSITPKLHIVIDHLQTYLDETSKSLGECTDQTIEALHQVVNRTFTNSKYYIKYLDSEKHSEIFLDGIMHVNSYNM